MGAKLPRITARALIQALKRGGWYEARQSGGHIIFRHPMKSGRAVVPNRPGETVKAGTLAGILQDTGLSVEELVDLL